MTDQTAWAKDAAQKILDQFQDSAAIDTANYQLCSFILAAAKATLNDEDLAFRLGDWMEPPREGNRPTPPVRFSVQPDWMTKLPLQQQSVLFLAARGPDGIAKHHPCKDIVRYYRGTVLIAARYGRLLKVGEKADTFMSMDGFEDDHIFNERMKAYFDTIDELPHHYHMHLMHGAQILGYKHPEQLYRKRWTNFYYKCLDDSHTPHPETEAEMDERLSDWHRRHWDE